jgi:hypothetical protein
MAFFPCLADAIVLDKGLDERIVTKVEVWKRGGAGLFKSLVSSKLN